MKNYLNISYLLVGILFLFGSCRPTEYELGELLSQDDLEYTIEPSSENPNDIVLTSLTEGVTPLWTTPYELSTRVVDTVNIAFPGDYTFIYGVESDGGYVEADSVTVTIETLDESSVEGDLWTYLTGGYDQEKTWYLDLDSSGVSKYWEGPISYYGTDDSWETVTDGETVDGDSWNWSPAWASNTWICEATDFGSMTFNLKDGPYVQVDHGSTADGLTMGGQESGTFMLDEDEHTITLTGVSLIHPIEFDSTLTKSWTGELNIFSLTEDAMQIAVLRDEDISGEDACYVTFNFVSKDYYDSH